MLRRDTNADDGCLPLAKTLQTTGLFLLFIVQLINVIMVLLICSACASLLIAATGDRSMCAVSYVEGIAIMVIVVLNAGIAAVTENAANSALEALQKMSQAMCTVIRDGQEMRIDAVGAVEGDIVLLATGDVVPADIRIVESNELKVNEMCLTGEPDDVSKTYRVITSCVFSPVFSLTRVEKFCFFSAGMKKRPNTSGI